MAKKHRKLELIKAVIQEIECFWLQIIPISIGIIDKITRVENSCGQVTIHPLPGRLSVYQKKLLEWDYGI